MTQPDLPNAVCSRPFFMQAVTGDADIVYTSTDFRMYSNAILHRTGVLDAGYLRVAQADNVGFKIKVRAGIANVNGAYIVALPADAEISLTGFNTSPPFKTTHKVWVAIYDKNADPATLDYSGRIVVTEDTGGGAPDPVSELFNGGAHSSLFLADVTMGPGQSNIQDANISNRPRHGGMAGNPVDLNPYLTTTQYIPIADGTTGLFRVVYNNGVARMGGGITRNGGGTSTPPFATGIHRIGRMPPEFWPTQSRRMICATSIDDATKPLYARLRVYPDGAMEVHIPAGGAPTSVMFDGVTYDLD